MVYWMKGRCGAKKVGSVGGEWFGREKVVYW